MEVVPHHLIDADAHALEADDPVAEEDAVAVPLPAGGCTIHHCRTLHYAGANRSTEPRRAYIMGFSVPAQPLDEPRDYYWQRPEWHR
jgi:ectoine hydroxylase-related dioxygenase (phytanoyl-CoA dioxygenase family)